jgi:hypothetical protein
LAAKHGICRVDDTVGPIYKAGRWRRAFRRHCSFGGSALEFDRSARTNGNFKEQSFN